MFGSRRGGTVIGDGLKIVGNVTAEGLVKVNGQIEGDLIALRSLSVRRPRSSEVSLLSESLWTAESRVPFTAATWCLSRRRMSLAIFITNLLPLRRAPTLMAARHKLMEPTVASPRELPEGAFERPRETAARLMLSRLA